jgi:DnaJ-class molecular chaperone
MSTRSCDSCFASGLTFYPVFRCKKCKGSKTVRQKKTVTVLVERGARTGDRIVLRGEGEEYVSYFPDVRQHQVTDELIKQLARSAGW